MNRILLSTALTASLAAGVLAAAPAASASDGDGVRNAGSCSGRSTWELKAKHDDGRIEVEFEVDSNVVGQTWNVRLTDNGVVVLRRQATTRAPSGSFEVETRIGNRAGVDYLKARATNPATGETCVGRVHL